MTIGQVMQAMEVGRTATYRRVAACIDMGLLERLEILRSEAGLLRATRSGIRYAGLGLPVAAVSPGNVEHWLCCASTAISLGARYGADRVLTEREIVQAELAENRMIASVTVGGSSRDGPLRHRADLAVLAESGRIVVEVELSPKSPRRLERLIRAWRREVATGPISEVHYLCGRGPARRAVERAVANVHAQGQIRIAEVESR